MIKKMFAIRLGLAALLLLTLCTGFAGSSFASTALAISTKDVDAPAASRSRSDRR